MVKEFKEHWQVAIVTAIVVSIITSTANWAIGSLSKINDAATTEYVDEQDKLITNEIRLKPSQKYVDDQNVLQDKKVDRTEILFLGEIKELRKDLRLKSDKQ